MRDSLAGVVGINNILSDAGAFFCFGRKQLSETLQYGLLQSLKPILISAILLLCVCCQPDCPAEIRTRDYVDLYDEAVNLYYKPPFQSEQAMQLLEQGCACNPDHQDLSCYNLGVMREIRGEKDAALQAYQKARQLKGQHFYELAIQRLDPDQAKLKSSYLKTVRSIVTACRQGQNQQALVALRNYVTGDLAQATEQDSAAQPGRAVFAQPFIAECLKGESYEQLLQKIPEKPSLMGQYYKERAQLDEFHTIFDMELYYRKELERTDSKQEITETWQIVMDAGHRGNGNLAASALREMFALLGTAGRKSAAERVKAQAMRRAAAVLVDRDLYFSKIKGHPEVRAVIRPVLGGG